MSKLERIGLYARFGGILLGALVIYFAFHHSEGVYGADLLGDLPTLRYLLDTLIVLIGFGMFYVVCSLEKLPFVKSRLENSEAQRAARIRKNLFHFRVAAFATSLHSSMLLYCLSAYSSSAKYMVLISLLTGLAAFNRSLRAA